jgi:cytidylate kinase
VIVGRGAAQILPEATTLRVRLGGPKAGRVKAIRDRFDLGAEEAERWVTETDRRRTGFVRDHFHKDPDDPANYDVTLNTCRLGVGDCADLIVTALEQLKGLREAPAASQRHVPLAAVQV